MSHVPAARTKGTRIPDDWRPSEELVAYGARLLLTRGEVEGAGEEMRLWGLANANRALARKADWSLTFQGWLRRGAPQIIRNRPRGTTNGQAQGAGAGRAGFSGIAAGLRARVADAEREFQDGGERPGGRGAGR